MNTSILTPKNVQPDNYVLESILSLKGVKEFSDDLSVYEGEQNKLQKFYTKWILSKPHSGEGNIGQAQGVG